MKKQKQIDVEKFVFDQYLVIERYSVSSPWYENVWHYAVEIPKRFLFSLF